jgi:hypothetical protein
MPIHVASHLVDRSVASKESPCGKKDRTTQLLADELPTKTPMFPFFAYVLMLLITPRAAFYRDVENGEK